MATTTYATLPLLHRFLGIGLVMLATTFFILKYFEIALMLVDGRVTQLIAYAMSGAALVLAFVAYVVLKPRVPEHMPGQSVDQFWFTPAVGTTVLPVWFCLEGAGCCMASQKGCGYRPSSGGTRIARPQGDSTVPTTRLRIAAVFAAVATSVAAASQQSRGLKVFISVDMEGLAGVVTGSDVNPTGPDYAHFRAIMAGETNAAIEGAIIAGATEVVVRDSHGVKQNLLPGAVDPRARLLRGQSTGPRNMMEGIDKTFDAVVFIGYHAKAGTPNAILEHTSTGNVVDFSINGVSLPEGGYNAVVAGMAGVPVVFAAGDKALVDQLRALLGPIRRGRDQGGGRRRRPEPLAQAGTGGDSPGRRDGRALPREVQAVYHGRPLHDGAESEGGEAPLQRRRARRSGRIPVLES